MFNKIYSYINMGFLKNKTDKTYSFIKIYFFHSLNYKLRKVIILIYYLV